MFFTMVKFTWLKVNIQALLFQLCNEVGPAPPEPVVESTPPLCAAVNTLSTYTTAVQASVNTVTIGTQLSKKAVHFRSAATSTDMPMMVDVGTQYDPPSASSTPEKTAPSPPPWLMSPVEESPIKSIQNDLYKPSESSLEQVTEDETTHDEDFAPVKVPYDKDRKYIVFESKLLELFNVCPVCSACTRGKIKKEVGSMVHIQIDCSNCKAVTRDWKSQPENHQTPMGNLLTSAAILLSGALPSQVLRMFDIMNVAMHTRKTFHRHQSKYIIPTIVNVWTEEQQTIMTQLRDQGRQLDLAGDGRSDSPGHSAKYGGYTLIEQNIKKIIDIQLVQSNEVGSSNACELEGLDRCVKTLENNGLSMGTLVTDRHIGINCYIAKTLKQRPVAKDLIHYYDIWHVAKGLRKKLDALGRKYEEIKLWKPSIVNHLYYSAATVPAGETELLEAMWVSVADHIEDMHIHDGPYEMCDHGPLVNEEDRDKDWLEPGSVEAEALRDVLHGTKFLKDVKRLSPKFQTSTLEAFHSLIIRFCPKHTHFGWLCQLARYYLAVLHFNENSSRLQAVTIDGQPRYSIRFPKHKKGEYSLRIEKTPSTYNYTSTIMQRLFQDHDASPKDLENSIKHLRDKKPPNLSHQMKHPGKTEAVQLHMRRFPNQ